MSDWDALDPRECYRAVVGRDRSRVDDFVYGVVSRGTVCRIGCRSRAPLPQDVRYFRTVADAVDAGLRPCWRCRPDAVRGIRRDDPEAALAMQALEQIRLGIVDEIGVAGLALRLDVTPDDLRRAMVHITGATPEQHAIMARTLGRDDLAGANDWAHSVMSRAASLPLLRGMLTRLRRSGSPGGHP